jgi:glyoxylase-like metal-dependent hydrolase (beta-lactamase superfamily II)
MSETPVISVNEYPGGILAMDSGFVRDRMACCYLLEEKDQVAVIETGTNASAERILAVLGQRGWDVGEVPYVIVTHVHLDHAGGAGRLLQALPNATLLVHPRGARHVIDPSKLEASARRVYGDEAFDRVYGSLIPVPAARVREMADGDELRFGGRTLRFVDTPGHASHHFCIHDDRSQGWFTGDTFGLSYRELDTDRGPFVFPTTTPIDFDPHAMHTSVGKLLSAGPEWMYLTHFGRVGDVERLAAALLSGVDALVEIAERHRDADQRQRAMARDMQDWLVAAARTHGVNLPDAALLELLALDIELNSQGLDVWLTRRASA